MNKLVVVAKNSETYFIKRLIEEVGDSHVAIFNPWTDFVMPEGENYLVRTTGVYQSDLDLMMIKTLPQERVINPLQALQLFRSKSSQYTWFDDQNFRALPWLPLKGTDMITIEKFFRLHPESVVKPLVGQGGWGIEALRWDGFQGWWKKRRSKDEDYLIQPMMRDTREYRHFFIKGEFEFTLERKAKSGVAANFRNQGEAVVAQLPDQVKSEVALLIEKSQALYGAIDLFIERDRMIVLELNTVPGIEQLEVLSGLNVMKILLSAKFFCHIS